MGKYEELMSLVDKLRVCGEHEGICSELVAAGAGGIGRARKALNRAERKGDAVRAEIVELLLHLKPDDEEGGVMPVLKRATKKLKDAGIDLEVRRGVWGYYALDPRWPNQECTRVHDSAAEVVADVLAGARPVEVEVE